MSDKVKAAIAEREAARKKAKQPAAKPAPKPKADDGDTPS